MLALMLTLLSAHLSISTLLSMLSVSIFRYFHVKSERMTSGSDFSNATTSLYNLSDTMTNSSTNSCEPFDLAVVLYDQRPVAMDISVYAPPTWWVIGIVGNVIALLVWLQPKMRHSSGYYLAALAISDLFFLIFNIIYEVNFTHHADILDKEVLCQWFVISYLSLQLHFPGVSSGVYRRAISLSVSPVQNHKTQQTE